MKIDMNKPLTKSRYCDGKVIAHSNDPLVLRKAIKKCKTIPELVLVPKKRCEYPSLFKTT